MTFTKTVDAIKRNTRLLGEIEEATDFRIAYKTKDGWKRLRLPDGVARTTQIAAGRIVSARLDKLVPAAVDVATDAAMKTLVDLLNA